MKHDFPFSEKERRLVFFSAERPEPAPMPIENLDQKNESNEVQTLDPQAEAEKNINTADTDLQNKNKELEEAHKRLADAEKKNAEQDERLKELESDNRNVEQERNNTDATWHEVEPYVNLSVEELGDYEPDQLERLADAMHNFISVASHESGADLNRMKIVNPWIVKANEMSVKIYELQNPKPEAYADKSAEKNPDDRAESAEQQNAADDLWKKIEPMIAEVNLGNTDLMGNMWKRAALKSNAFQFVEAAYEEIADDPKSERAKTLQQQINQAQAVLAQIDERESKNTEEKKAEEEKPEESNSEEEKKKTEAEPVSYEKDKKSEEDAEKDKQSSGESRDSQEKTNQEAIDDAVQAIRDGKILEGIAALLAALGKENRAAKEKDDDAEDEKEEKTEKPKEKNETRDSSEAKEEKEESEKEDIRGIQNPVEEKRQENLEFKHDQYEEQYKEIGDQIDQLEAKANGDGDTSQQEREQIRNLQAMRDEIDQKLEDTETRIVDLDDEQTRREKASDSAWEGVQEDRPDNAIVNNVKLNEDDAVITLKEGADQNQFVNDAQEKGLTVVARDNGSLAIENIAARMWGDDAKALNAFMEGLAKLVPSEKKNDASKKIASTETSENQDNVNA